MVEQQLVVVVGGSGWVAEIDFMMKKPMRVSSLFQVGWLLMGLLFVSCGLIPGSAIKPATSVSPTLTDTIPAQPNMQPVEPVMSLDLSANQEKQQVLTALIWLPDGRFALSGSGGISLYRLPKAGLQPQAIPAFQSQVAAENPTLLRSTPDGVDLAWITAGHTVVYWNTAQEINAANISASDSPITGLALNPNKKELAYSTLNGEMFLWGSGSQSVIQKWQQSAWLSDLSFSPDGQYLAGVDPSSFAATIYTQDGQVIKRLEWTEAVNSSILGAFFSPDWKKLAWVSQSAVQFMDVASGKTTILLNHEDAVGAVAWAPDSILFATSSTITQGEDITAAVLVWDSNTGKLLHTYPQSAPVQSITFAPDNLSLAVLDVTSQLHVWELNQ
jgi:WD40 repeat protein